MKKLTWTKDGWEDYLYWQATDKNLLLRVNQLIKDIQRHPVEGIGKPEPLKLNLAGKWSRRITEEHRLVYEIQDNEIIIYQCRHHY